LTIFVPSLTILISVVLVLSCGQTDRQTESQTDADARCTHATTVGVSKYVQLCVSLGITCRSGTTQIRPIDGSNCPSTFCVESLTSRVLHVAISNAFTHTLEWTVVSARRIGRGRRPRTIAGPATVVGPTPSHGLTHLSSVPRPFSSRR